MKIKIIILSLIALSLLSPVTAYMSWINATPLDATVSSGAINNTWDGNTASEVVLNSAGGSVIMTPVYGTTTVLLSCDVYYVAGNPTKTYGFCEQPGGMGTKCQNNSWRLTANQNAWTTKTFPEPLTLSNGYLRMGEADGGWFGTAEIRCKGYNATYTDFQVAADFTGTPLNGTAPLVVSFTDTSTPAGTTTWNWSSSPIAGVSWSSTTSQNATAWFNINGNYTIIHGASNGVTSDIETKTDYVHVLNSSVLSTTYVTAINALTSYPIHGAQVDLQDVENGSWSNTTTTDGTGSITTLFGHHINGYASATGFDSNDKLGFDSGGWESILLFSPGLKNVTAGNVTLYVYTYDSADHTKAIKGAGITVVSSTGGWSGYTNDGGMISFTVPNKTVLLIDAKALGQGYQGATQSVNSGTGSGGSASVTATFYLNKNTLTPTATVTTLPGGGTPTPTTTVLPGCEDPNSAECQASQNNASMAWLSANAFWLIQLCVIMTALYIVGWKP